MNMSILVWKKIIYAQYSVGAGTRTALYVESPAETGGRIVFKMVHNYVFLDLPDLSVVPDRAKNLVV